MAKLNVGVVVGLLILGLAVSACGRRGALEPPPGKAVSTMEEDAAADAERTDNGRPTKRFILDGLL